MAFTFEIGADGQLAVTGLSVDAPVEWSYHREGPYHLDGKRLVTPVLNEGQPVRVRATDDGLLLTITDDLWFRLRRG
jgi:hypothetical protein